METQKRIYLSWSGGKDSALALYRLIRSSQYDIAGLLTTVTRDYDRISMHGVRVSLLERQAHSLNVPLKIIFISKNADNDEYEKNMREACEEIKKEGVSTIAFGDIFLEDLKLYREQNLSRIGMDAVFPLWKIPSADLVDEFLRHNFGALTVVCDPQVLSEHFVGKQIDRNFFDTLPGQVDPCGENGEFHSFVFRSPDFTYTIPIKIGEKILRDGFWFCDIIGDDSNSQIP